MEQRFNTLILQDKGAHQELMEQRFNTLIFQDKGARQELMSRGLILKYFRI